ncbi:HAMP domain-containing histidine kinase [Oculatella sp. LEGE 06141]|nr:HAMP domain-containing histidine kinase [Oculatella sp. LEGE 06141]
MLNFWNTLLSSQGFIPHGHCYLWKPDLVWLHIVSDGAIALAYYSIPITLLYFVSKRDDVPFNWVFGLFGAFIVACGTGHLMEIWTLWHPTYWLAGGLKAITAIISVYTALELVSLIPLALSLPSPAQLEAANRELEDALSQLQQTQSQLIQTEKMSSLGQLVAGIAHEINNPVNFIHGNLTYIHQYADDLLSLLRLYHATYPSPSAEIQKSIGAIELDFIEEDLPKTIDSMKIGADRIRQIVLSLRNFSRVDESDMKPVNIHDGIEGTLLILQNRLKAKSNCPSIKVVKDYGAVPQIECYAGQLNQVFMNILSNAIDALEQTNLESLSSQSQPYSGQITIQTNMVEQQQVQIQITDNGSGIPLATQTKIFDPFFTTKPTGKGTGLGLAISYQIVVQKHGGTLNCISTEQGTTFQITIPIRQSHPVLVRQAVC